MSDYDLSEYIVSDSVGSASTKYVIPDGKLGNNTGSSIEVIVPNDVSNITGLCGQINSDAKNTWIDIEDSLLSSNQNFVTVKLNSCSGNICSFDARSSTATTNMQALDVIGNIFGIDEATVIGASNGSAIAISTAAESAAGDYSVKVTNAVYTDYANPNSIDFSSELEKMSEGNVILTAITDTEYSESSGTGYVAKLYSSLGGESEVYLYGSGYSHDTKCAAGALGYVGIDSGYNFTKYFSYSEGNIDNTVEYTDSVVNLLFNELRGDYVVLKSDYAFVDACTYDLISTIENMSVANAICSEKTDSGSATLNAISGTYNNYLENSNNLLNDSKNLCLNILNISNNIKQLDITLADSVYGNIGSCLDEMNFDVDACIEELTNYVLEDGVQGTNIKITKDELQNAMSGNNVIVSTMLQDVEDTYVLIAGLESFITDSESVLLGDGWDMVRGKIGNYCVALRKKNEYALGMVDKFNEAYRELYEYMEGFVILDTSKIPEVEKNISDLENQIQMLNETKAALEAEHGKEVCDAYDDNGNCTASHKIDNSAKIAAVSESISMATQLKNEYVALLNKLNNIHKVDMAIANSISTLASTFYSVLAVFK